MASKRKPLGVYARDTPDWFYGKMCIGGTYASSGVGQVGEVLLYNEGSYPGESLFVYGVECSSEDGTPLQMFTIEGQRGVLFGVPQHIDSWLGQPPGSLYSNTGGVSGNFGNFRIPTSNQVTIGKFGPLAIVRPNYSLVIAQTLLNKSLMHASFYFAHLLY
jgi:hypothetical protein